MKSGDTLVASADVSLKITREIFSLIVDVASPENPKVKSRGEITLTGKRSPWSGTISAPKDTKKFQEFADALSALDSTDKNLQKDIPMTEGSAPV